MNQTMRTRGFTLIELLVVIAIIGMLAAVILASLSQARFKARDAQRTLALNEFRKAAELYFTTNGHYPYTCVGVPWTSFDSLAYGSNQLCSTQGGSTQVGTLAAVIAPYLSNMSDPKNLGGDSGYLYTSNGSGYCFMAYRTPEDLRDFPAYMVNPNRCGSKNTTAQCSSAGTGGGTTNSIYVGSGSYNGTGC